MEDLTGLGKIADSQLVNRVYDDAISGAAKEVGKLAEDVAKAFRLFTLPIQLAATAQDRITAWLDHVRSRVPEERQTEAPPSLAGPVIRNLVFMDKENPLLELYLELLIRAIDSERQGQTHPAFVTIIEQMSPDEALCFYSLANGQFSATLTRRGPNVHLTYDSATGVPKIERGYGTESEAIGFKRDGKEIVDQRNELETICGHLISLSIVEWKKESSYESCSLDIKKELVTVYDLKLTQFGRLFADACLPEEFGSVPSN